MPATQQETFPAHAESTQAFSDRRHFESEKSDGKDFELEMPNEAVEGGFEPILPTTMKDNNRLRKLHSTGSRSVERSWSLNDGYSCNNVDAEASAAGPDALEAVETSEFVVSWDEVLKVRYSEDVCIYVYLYV
ncbi:hypothetical protein BJX70DRAFT_383717 [Aspergillus crustosus]